MEPETPFGRPRVLAAAIAFLLIANGGAIYDTSFYSIGPGPASDVLEMIEVSGAQTYESEGSFLLTTVAVSDGPLNIWEFIEAWAQPSIATVHRSRLIPPGVTDEENDRANARQMEESKLDAEAAAFFALGLEVTVRSGGRIQDIVDGGPSDGNLEARDLILAVGNVRTRTAQEVVSAIRALPVGATARLQVIRDGEELVVSVRTAASPDDSNVPVIGASVIPGRYYRFPHDVAIDTNRIGGPSGGLVFALSLVDALTPEDLTGGRAIAVTGTISLGPDGDGIVGPIGGVEEKVAGALAAGAEVFIVPADDLPAAQAVAPDSLTLVGVETLSDALEALRRMNRNTRV